MMGIKAVQRSISHSDLDLSDYTAETIMYLLLVLVSRLSNGSQLVLPAESDNAWMATKTARIARQGPEAIIAVSDPWLRYLPQAVITAILPSASPQLAFTVNAAYIVTMEALLLPLVLAAVARAWTGRRGSILVLGLIAAGRVAMQRLGDLEHLFSPLSPVGAATSETYLALRNLAPWTYHTTVVLGLAVLAWVIYSRDDIRTEYVVVPAIWVGAHLLLASKMWVIYSHWVFRTVATSTHWYWGLALPLAAATAVAAHRGIVDGDRRWVVATGVLLGATASIQLAEGFVLACSVGAVAVVYGRWRRLVTAAGAAIVVWSPTLVTAIANDAWYQSQGSRVVDVDPVAVVVAVAVGVFAVAVLRFAVSSNRDSRVATLVTLLVAGWAGAQVVAAASTAYWSAYQLVILRPYVYLALVLVALRVVDVAGEVLDETTLPTSTR